MPNQPEPEVIAMGQTQAPFEPIDKPATGSGPEKVPVDERWAGLDRRSLLPAGVVIGIWLLWTVAVPHLDAAVDQDDPVRVGDRFAITDDLAITAPSGWNVENGFRTTALPSRGPTGGATFARGAVTVTISAQDYDGTAIELLEQIEKVTSATGSIDGFHVTEGRSQMTTNSGLVGVAESYTAVDSDGMIAAFVSDGTGVEVLVSGQPSQKSATAHQVTEMIESLGSWDSADAGKDGES